MNSASGEHSAALDSYASSARDLADLARAGYELMQQPFTHVDFEIHHTVDRAGYMRDNLFLDRREAFPEEVSGGSAAMVSETLASAANGVGLVIRTNTDSDVPDSRRVRLGRPAATLVTDEPTRRVFSGSGLPNPTFLFESAATYEGIVSVEPAPRSIKFYQSAAMRDLIREVSRIAANVAHMPLLYLQAPAQLPAQSFIGQDVRSSRVTAARRSSSLALRFAIAMERPSAALRFELTEILTRYCTERGFGLWLADTRVGYRSGNWFQICAQADDLSRRDRRERATSVDSRAVEVCLPITFIGPARRGSTHAIVSFLCQFGDVGIGSCATITLHDLEFIHLQLTLRGIRRSALREINSYLTEHSCWKADPSDALMHIHNTLAVAREEYSSHVLAGELSEYAGDYQTLVGPALGCTVPDSRKRIAVWFSWQMEGTGEDLALPLVELFRSFSDIGLGPSANADAVGTETPNLEYLVCRDVGNWVLRGRGKLSIPEVDMLQLFHGMELESAAARLCVSIENAWKTSLRRRGAHGVSELTVAWREWWLGHWASLI
jgi:hypothetical protein